MVDIAINQREFDAKGLLKFVEQQEQDGFCVWINQKPIETVSLEQVVLHRFQVPQKLSIVRFQGTVQLKDVLDGLSPDREATAPVMILTRTDTPALPSAFQRVTIEGLKLARDKPQAITFSQQDLEEIVEVDPEVLRQPVLISNSGQVSMHQFRSIINDGTGMAVAGVAFLAALGILTLTLFRYESPKAEAVRPVAAAEETTVPAEPAEVEPAPLPDVTVPQEAGTPAEPEPAPTAAAWDPVDPDLAPETSSVEQTIRIDTNVRSGPGLDFAVIAGVKPGRTVTVIGDVDPTGWAMIELATGQQGYVFAPLLSGAKTDASGVVTIRDCDQCPTMVMVPAGNFAMGSTVSEPGHMPSERPVHMSRIGQPYLVAKFEVTFEEWDACVAGGGCDGYEPPDNGWGRGKRPVIHVSWKDAQNYVAWLQSKTGKAYRLLSETEWEYAARAGTSEPFAFGRSITPEQVVFNGEAMESLSTGGAPAARTAESGSRPANGFGLHHMHGNVREWVADCWNETYMGAVADASARTSGDCAQHVLRGGSWTHGPEAARSAARAFAPAEERSASTGFRVMRTL